MQPTHIHLSSYIYIYIYIWVYINVYLFHSQICLDYLPKTKTVPNVSDGTEINCKYAIKLSYPSSNDCQSYYKCVNSYDPPTKLSCSDNLQFNPVLQRCDRPEIVVNIRPECSTSIWLTQENSKFSNARVNNV